MRMRWKTPILAVRIMVVLFLIQTAVYGNDADTNALEDSIKGLDFPSVYTEAMWENRYVSEGRDYLEGDGTITGFTSLSYGDVSLDTSYREGLDLKYSELNIGPSYEHDFEDFYVSAYFYQIRFLREDLNNHEVGVGVVYTGLPMNLSISADIYYSLEWEGSFSLFALSNDWQISDRLNIQQSAIFGINLGYVPDAHDGPNHFALRIDGEYQLSENVSLTAYIAQNWEIGKESFDQSPGDYDLRNFLWTGAGIMVIF